MTQVTIPAAQFEEFLDKFSDYLDEQDSMESAQSTELTRIPRALDNVSTALMSVSDSLQRLSIKPETPDTTVNNTIVENNTKELVQKTEIIKEEQFQGNMDADERDTTTHRLLREIRDATDMSAQNSGMMTMNAVLDQIMNITMMLDDQFSTQNAMLMKSNGIAIASGGHLKRISQNGTMTNAILTQSSMQMNESLANMSQNFTKVVEETARRQQEEQNQKDNKENKKKSKQNGFVRQSYTKMNELLTGIKTKIFDPRFAIGMTFLKNLVGGVGQIAGTLSSIFAATPGLAQAQNVAQALGGYVVTAIRFLLNPKKLIATLLFAGGPIGLAIRAAGVAFYSLFSEELNGLFKEIVDLISSPERLQNLYDEISTSAGNMYDGLKNSTNEMIQNIQDGIASGFNTTASFFASIGPQFDMMVLNMQKRLADFIRENVPDFLGGDRIASAVGPSQEEYDAELAGIQGRLDTINETDYAGMLSDRVGTVVAEQTEIAAKFIDEHTKTFRDAAMGLLDDGIQTLQEARTEVSGGLMEITETVRQAGRGGTIENLNNQIAENQRQQQMMINQQNNQTTNQTNNTTINAKPIDPVGRTVKETQRKAL